MFLEEDLRNSQAEVSNTAGSVTLVSLMSLIVLDPCSTFSLVPLRYECGAQRIFASVREYARQSIVELRATLLLVVTHVVAIPCR